MLKLSDPSPTVSPMTDPTDRELLQLAGAWHKYRGTREQAMRDRFDLNDVQFWRRVNAIVDAPSREVALEFGPLLKVLRDRRERGMAARTSRRAG